MRTVVFFLAAWLTMLFFVSCGGTTTKGSDADQATGNDGIVTDEEIADDGFEIGDEDEPTKEEPITEEEPVFDDTPEPTDQPLPDEVTDEQADEQSDETGDIEEESDEVSDETAPLDDDQPLITDSDTAVVPETDTPVSDADTDTDADNAPCSLDDSFFGTMPSSWNSYFTLKMSGLINDPNTDPPTMAYVATVNSRLLGASRSLSNSYGYYARSTVQDAGGNTYPAITELSTGSLTWPVSGKLADLWASQTFVLVDDLVAWKQQAENEGLTGVTIDGVSQVAVFELWIEISGSNQYLRMECIRGLSALKDDKTAYDGSMFVCVDQNTSWAIGETMRMIEYSRMLDQKSDILAALNEGLTPGDPDYRTDICTCYTKDVDANGNPTTTMDCEDMKDEFGLGELPDADTVDTDSAASDDGGQPDQPVPDEDSAVTDETQPDDAADADEVLSDDDTITIPPCAFPSEWLSNRPVSWESYLTLRVSGLINDPNDADPDMADSAEATTRLNGSVFDLDNWYSFVARSFVQDGQGNLYPAVFSVNGGSVSWVVPGQLLSSQGAEVFTPVDDLLAAKNWAETQGVSAMVFDGVYQVTVREYWYQYVSGMPLRMECIRGLSALNSEKTAYDGALYVCVDENTDWSVGETLRMMEYVRMLDDETEILAALNEGLAPEDPGYWTTLCFCYAADGTTPMDCDDMKAEFGL